MAVWLDEDAEKGLGLNPITSKFSSMRMVGKKGSVAFFNYNAIVKGTSQFSDGNILGEGGFGCVYRAQLDDNFLVAVKKINNGIPDAEREFQVPSFTLSITEGWFYSGFGLYTHSCLSLQNEVDLLSKIQHPNIISLLGSCIHEETRLIVYELMPNGSLENQLHGKVLLFMLSKLQISMILTLPR